MDDIELILDDDELAQSASQPSATVHGEDAYDPRALEEKVVRVFGSLAIDKRRLPASKLQSRGVPGYVGEWVIDTVVGGSGPLSNDDAAKIGA